MKPCGLIIPLKVIINQQFYIIFFLNPNNVIHFEAVEHMSWIALLEGKQSTRLYSANESLFASAEISYTVLFV